MKQPVAEVRSFDALRSSLEPYRRGYHVDGAILIGPRDDLRVLLRPTGVLDALALRATWSKGAVALTPLSLADDAALVGARVVTDQKALTGLLQGSLDHVHRVRVVGYRPGRRAVLEVRGLAAGKDRCLYLKLLRPREFLRAQATFDALPSLVRLQFARPERVWPDLACFALASAEGRSIHDCLRSSQAVPWASIRDTLRELHERRAPDDAVVYGAEEERAATHKLLVRALDTLPSLAPLCEVVASTEVPASSPRRWIHRDLHDKQVFVASDRVTLIDVEGASAGDPRSDLVNLEEHLRLRDLQADRRPRPPCLFAGFDDASTRRTRGLIRARLAGVYGRRPGWHHLARRLALESLELLS